MRDEPIRALFEFSSEEIVGGDRDGRIVLAILWIESMFGYCSATVWTN